MPECEIRYLDGPPEDPAAAARHELAAALVVPLQEAVASAYNAWAGARKPASPAEVVVSLVGIEPGSSANIPPLWLVVSPYLTAKLARNADPFLDAVQAGLAPLKERLAGLLTAAGVTPDVLNDLEAQWVVGRGRSVNLFGTTSGPSIRWGSQLDRDLVGTPKSHRGPSSVAAGGRRIAGHR